MPYPPLHVMVKCIVHDDPSKEDVIFQALDNLDLTDPYFFEDYSDEDSAD